MTGAAQANLDTLKRIFTIPEQPDSTLGAIDQAITRDVTAFLRTHIVNIERSLEEIEQDFLAARVPEEPTYVSDYTEFVKDKLVAHSVHTASPGFVGHMTSALPNFMLPLSRILVALNQNLVKVETSKAFTPLERQVLAMLHHLIYNRKEDFYQDGMHDSSQALGVFCSGGTIANCTALWAARNQLLKPRGNFGGLAREGLFKALQFLDCEGLAVLVSRRAHYSLSKAVDLLGLGRDNLILVDTDDANRIDLNALRRSYQELLARNIRPLTLVGIAGTTETGHIDPLEQLADFAAEIDCHFHVDAAWGGPTLFSDRHRALLRGIERADSVTFDAHKQLYVPMGAGMVLFRDPQTASAIEHHANYILRPGSKDLGSHTLEGSRPGQALLVHAGLSIIGRKGYELLIDLGIERARQFSTLIEDHPDFELISAPQLNILTYRYCPAWLQKVLPELSAQLRQQLNELLDELVTRVQKQQREAGQTFVSRTRLRSARYPETGQLTVFRSVLANPLTTEEILCQVLAEQVKIVARDEFRPLLKQLQSLARVGESSVSTDGDSD